MTETAWTEIQQVIMTAPYPVTVLPFDSDRADACLASFAGHHSIVARRSWPIRVEWWSTTGGFACSAAATADFPR